MPSVDVIRNVTIKGKADGVDDATAALNRLTASIQAANDNLAKSRAIAQDNNEAFRITGEGAATAANHLRQAAEAAYAFSPAFRGVVNEMAVPALRTAGTALEVVAAGIVTATNVAGTSVVKLGGAIATTFPAFAVLAGNVKAAGAAMEAFSPTLTGTAATIASKLLPALSLLGKGLLIYDAIKLVAQAWELGNAKLAEYVALSEKAAASGVSTDFFQRLGKAAEAAVTPVDTLTAAMKKLNDAAAPQLGGNAAENRFQALLDAGNFKGNTGVTALKQANDTEERFTAIVSLVHQAMDAGQRLAALDLTKSFMGPDVADRLAKDSEFLDRMQGTINNTKAADLVSDQTVANAVELQNRLDAAEKILSQRWHPIQDILTQLGIKMKEAWVDIVEAIANAVDFVFKLADKIATAIAPLMDFLKMADQVLARAAQFAGNALGPIGAAISAGGTVASNLLSSAPAPTSPLANSGLNNPANVSRAKDYSNTILDKVRTDNSFDPDKKKIGDDTAAYDRATESILKYIETAKAAAGAVSDAAGEQEKFKVIAQLTAAAEKDGTTITASLRDEMTKLGERAGAAADALAKARETSNIDFGRKTAFLSQEDVAIATELKGIYGNDIPAALNSTYAAGIRVNNAFKEVSSSIESNLTSGLTDMTTGAKSAGNAFSDMSNQIIRAIEQMIIKITIVQPLMQALQSTIGGGGGILGLLGLGGPSFLASGSIPGAIGPTSVGGAPLVAAAGMHSGGIVGSDATFVRQMHPGVFDGARRFHDGGIVGDEVPIIARRGERVLTAEQSAAWGGGGRMPNVTINNYSGAQPTVARSSNGDVTVTLKKAIDGAVGDSLSMGAGRRVLAGQYGVKPFTGQ